MTYPLFLRTYNSPFKPLKLRWYFGRVRIGVPIFMPRIWRKYTMQDCIEAATKDINNPNLVKKSFEEWLEYYKHYSKAVPKKIGLDFCDLFWKMKYNQYRHEYSPVWSFVCFGYQIAIRFVAPPDTDIHYWECFLYYYYETDRSESRQERVEQCRKDYSCTWTRHNADGKETIDYYEHILKKRYL